jgi:hypothetical protein
MKLRCFLCCLAMSACGYGGDPDNGSDAGTDPCEGITCSGHGQCVEDNGTPECRCDSGYHAVGLECVPNADPCQGVNCSGHGTCLNDGGTARCDCDEGYEADGLECRETLCACRERTKVDYSLCQYAQKCATASDCCPDPASIAPLVCNQDWPYRYSCTNGYCEALTCDTNAHCSAYFQYVQQNTPGVWVNDGCVTNECPPHNRWCSWHQAQTCTTATDCCPDAASISPYVCQQDYPYVYSCENGSCKTVYCTQDSHCQLFGENYNPADGWVNLGCIDNIDPCTGELYYGMCTFKQACSTYQDCCPEATGDYTCGVDYPYLYECRDNLCESQWCSSDSQCSVYFLQMENTYPGKYANLGCVQY